MASIRFLRRIPLIPGLVYLNISKCGVSLSFGVRGASCSVGKRGVVGRIGVPGTGLSVSQRLIKKRKKK